MQQLKLVIQANTRWAGCDHNLRRRPGICKDVIGMAGQFEALQGWSFYHLTK